jgi:hypothetical protein
MCDDVWELVTHMKRHKVRCSRIRNQGWGVLTQVTLTGSGILGIYQARHPRPESGKSTAGKRRKRQ